ncbi:hypothetical protein MMC30_001514 [Trapelia coarctata]|nr:hypothetical protein [Trapelia coarctata]
MPAPHPPSTDSLRRAARKAKEASDKALKCWGEAFADLQRYTQKTQLAREREARKKRDFDAWSRKKVEVEEELSVRMREKAEGERVRRGREKGERARGEGGRMMAVRR